MRLRLSLTCSCSLTLTAALACQTSLAIDGGPLAGTHAAISRHRIPATSQDEVLLKPPGFHLVTPAPIAGSPDFRASVLFAPRAGCAMPLVTLNIDALSIGADLIETDPNGRLRSVFLSSYAALLFSVRFGTSGSPGGAIFAETTTTPYGALADIFSYIFPGSSIGPVDVTERAVDDTEIRLTGASLTSMEVDGLDWYIPLYELWGIKPTMYDAPVLYFSVDTASAPAVPLTWCGGVAALQSGATIFRTQWNPVSASWSCPVVCVQPSDLGLAPTEDIDALAVDTVLHAPETYFLFSTRPPTAMPSQLMFARVPAVVLALPLPIGVFRLINGTPVADRLGLGPGGDIDAISAVDPGWSGFVFGGGRCGGPWNGQHGQSLGFTCWHGSTGEGRVVGIAGTPLGLFPPGSTESNTWRTRCGASDCVMTFLISQDSGVPFLLISPPGSLTPLIALPVPARDPAFKGMPSIWSFPISSALHGSSLAFHWLEITGTVAMPAPSVFRF